jgi:hypothetical protein
MANEFVLPSEMPGFGEQQKPAVEEGFKLPSDAPPPKPEVSQPQSWGDVPGMALKNAPSSAYKFGESMVQPFVDPVGTATNISNLGRGVMEKAGILSGTEHVKYADAVWDDLVEKYGSEEGLKKHLANDPVGFLADASTLLTGGGMAAAKLPGVLGKVGEVAKTAGRLTDPLLPVAKGIQLAGKGAAEVVGLTSHVGHQALETAAHAGYQGGERARALRENMRGIAPMEDTIDDALKAVDNMRRERGAIYDTEMAKLRGRGRILPFNEIDNAMRDITNVQTFTGATSGIRKTIDPNTAAIRARIQEAVADWRRLPPGDFHTAEGLDALKRTLGTIYKETDFGTPDRRIAGRAYHAVRSTITKAFPEYAQIMKGYEKASDTLKEIENTLSLRETATVDTSLRKLQSILRDNVSTNYGQRRALAQYLIDNGSPMLMERLAGQALRPFAPRGLGKVTASLVAEIGALGGFGALAGAAHAGVAAIPAIAAMSPRIMGEGAYYAGRGIRGAELASRPSYYAGRIGETGREAEKEEARKQFKPGPYIYIRPKGGDWQ